MPIYMKVPGVTGTGKGKYQGWIELDSAQLGTNRHVTDPSGTATSREAGAPAVTEIVVTKASDTASTDLYKLSLWGQPKNVTIVFIKPDSKNAVPYMSLELEGVLVSSYSTSRADGSSNRARETLSLNAVKITFPTAPVEPSRDRAPSRMAWDLAAARGG